MPSVTLDGKRLQMIVCSATLHNFEVKKLADSLMHFPTWVDLKGQDAVPETVHHVVSNILYLCLNSTRASYSGVYCRSEEEFSLANISKSY
jgi:superfamily II DNA/RNA helicase